MSDWADRTWKLDPKSETYIGLLWLWGWGAATLNPKFWGSKSGVLEGDEKAKVSVDLRLTKGTIKGTIANGSFSI